MTYFCRCKLADNISLANHDLKSNQLRAIPFKTAREGWAGSHLKYQVEWGPEEIKCWGLDEYCTECYLKLNVEGRRDHQKLNVGGGG